MEYIKTILLNNTIFKILLIFVVLDLIFGILKAIKQHSLNSTIGIDGMIRKTGMIITVVFLKFIDNMISFNLLSFVPHELTAILKLQTIGISEFFSLMYIIFEALSVIKNAVLCELPFPKKIQTILENIMEKFIFEDSNDK